MPVARFIRRYLDPADRLGEILFGLIMALGITGATRLGSETADNRSLLIAVLGCNIAWGLVDGVTIVLLGLFERGRQARMVRAIRSAPDEQTALGAVAAEIDDRLEGLMGEEERVQVHRWILERLRRAPPRDVRVARDDVLGGIAAALVIFLATVPVVIPFLVVSDVWRATRISNVTGLVLLFALGHRYAKFTGSNPVKTGFGVMLVGVVLVLVTIALGG